MSVDIGWCRALPFSPIINVGNRRLSLLDRTRTPRPFRRRDPHRCIEPGWRRRWLALLVVSLTAFTAIALNAGSGSHLQAIDRQASQHLLAHGSGTWTVAMRWLARVHGVAGIALIVGTLWLAWLRLRGETMQLVRLALIVGGGLLLNSVLKRVFQRDWRSARESNCRWRRWRLTASRVATCRAASSSMASC